MHLVPYLGLDCFSNRIDVIYTILNYTKVSYSCINLNADVCC